MSNLLYTVKDIFGNESTSFLTSTDKECYNIPVYQRGYKWSNVQVSKLLTDISNFTPEENKFYCLQNITLVPTKESNHFNVVDGQQRLTTLVLLLSYLGQKDLAKNKVRFPNNSIRQETNKFLNEIIAVDAQSVLNNNWETFIKYRLNFDHQDIYYLHQSYNAIHKWFSEANEDKEEFLKKLLNNVKIIANNISDESKEEKIFGNLNSKRIPLDGADLVRAIIITRVAYEESKKTDTTKDIVRINERRVRIGWELDDINNWWSKLEVNTYFRRFIGIRSDEISEGAKLFKDDKYPINILLLLFAESQGESKLTLEFIEKSNNNTLALYKELIRLHTTLRDWFADREIYHYLGFLFAQKSIKFKDVWELWRSGSASRHSFCSELKNKMKSIIFSDDIVAFNSDANWYENDQNSLIKILILLDIYWSVKPNQPFLPASAFIRDGHDIEHIFPQNPRDISDKKAYLHFLIDNNLAPAERDLLVNFDEQIDDDTFLKRVDEFINLHIGNLKINSIGNLVLLNASKNRSLGNNIYSTKRASLIQDINNGVYIRPHTLKVFVRYFNTSAGSNWDALHWTNTDIDANANSISKNIENFFKA